MNSTGRERVKDLLARAACLEPDRRRAFIESEASDNVEIAAEAIDLLYTLDSVFMSAPTGAGFEESPAQSLRREGPGAKIGRYKLLQLIGEGGFGSVFMADQTEPVHRRVALKIIKAGMDTKQVIARFEAERQALAMMDHPNIARVLDAGATEAGRPYFVMELVRGEPVTGYCDGHRMSVRQRLKLFCDVCNAVQHAHQKGIIHRDLKPSNVLVTIADGAPLPKVIDFGIAKATASRLTDKTLFTELHQLIGTPEYMSPEQAEVSGVDIDTRSDVYSLGVMLYELLAGSTPLERERLRSTPLAEVQRLIREVDPPRPSLRLATLPPSSGAQLWTPVQVEGDSSDSSVIEIARRRQSEPLQLTRALRGDLDWIVMKCLEKDRSRRYATASALADDVGRYLTNQPVLATPPSTSYKLRKFVHRNRTLVLAGGIITMVLILGVIGTTLGMVWAFREQRQAVHQRALAQGSAAKARIEASRANREADQALNVNEFMRRVLTSAAPDKQGADVRLVDVLAGASAAATQRFAGHPLQEAQIHDMLGEIYDNLTEWAGAKAEFQKALSLWQEHAGMDDLRTLSSEFMFGAMAIQLQQAAEAEQVLVELLPKMNHVLGSDDPKTLDAQRSMAIAQLQQGRVDDAERILLELRANPRVADDDNAQIRILQALVSVNWHRANIDDRIKRRVFLDRAEPLARECVERLMRRDGPDGANTLYAQGSLADIACRQGKYAAAADACRDILNRSKDQLGECHFVRVRAMSTLAIALNAAGEEREPAELYLSKIQCMRRNNPPGSPQIVSDLFDALPYLDRAGRAVEGESIARELTEALQNLGGGHGDFVFVSELYIARFVSMQHRLDEAEPIFRTLLESGHPADSTDRARLHLFYSGYLVERGLFDEAERQLDTAVSLLDDIRLGTWESHPDDVIRGFIALYEAWGKVDLAQEYRGLQTEVVTSRTQTNHAGR